MAALTAWRCWVELSLGPASGAALCGLDFGRQAGAG